MCLFALTNNANLIHYIFQTFQIHKGALLRCKKIIKAKRLKIVGVDYNNLYIQAAQEAIHRHGMSGNISVHTLDIYNEKALQIVLKSEEITEVDSVYFSGSFSLMPDPKGALISVLKILNKQGKIYITQTYQKRTLPLMATIKPLIKFITTVDFGKLVTTQGIEETLCGVDGLNLEEHDVIQDSLDNYWQAAYLSVLARSGKTGKKLKGDDERKRGFFGIWF
jgi:hypothetical protein